MQLDLSTLRTPELRRLLDTARERGQAAQSYQILQEMARRRDGGERSRKPGSRRPAEPRVISLNLGDPLDVEDERPDVPEPAPQMRAEPQPMPEPDPTAGLMLERAPRPEPRRRPSPWPLAVFAAGAVAGVAFGGSFGANSLSALSSGFELPGVGTSAATPSAPAVEAAVEAPIVAAVEPPPVEAAVQPAAPEQLEVVLAPETMPEPLAPTTVASAPAEPAPAAAEPCVAGTPADRTICDSAELQRLQNELRTAYADALDAHADRGLLRQRQLAWRDARNTLTDPDRLARLYEERIRKLTAATADARRQR